MARHPGANSYRYVKNRGICLSTSDWCHWCGHRGARQCDHIVPRKLGGTDDLWNLAPIHGHDDRRGPSRTDFRCPTCGRSCNQERKAKSLAPPYRSRTW